MFIVYYHNVLPGPLDPYDHRSSRLAAHVFARQVDYLVKRLRPVSLPVLLAQWREGNRSEKSVAFTFDDGFQGVLDHAFPILEARGIPASVFVVTKRLEPPAHQLFHFDEIEIACRLTRRRSLKMPFLGALPHPMASRWGRAWTLKRIKRRLKVLEEEERGVWHARVLAELGVTPEQCHAYALGQEKYRTLDAAGLRTLIAAGWTIGSHTRTHRTVSRLAPADLRSEIEGSRDDLRRHLGLQDLPFAYPYGDAEHISPDARAAIERAGYPCALTTIRGSVADDGDPFALRRMNFQQLRSALRSWKLR
ncbi:MAG: polysaccharide deacetylase family protein [Acidobacteriota bacterium]